MLKEFYTGYEKQSECSSFYMREKLFPKVNCDMVIHALRVTSCSSCELKA